MTPDTIVLFRPVGADELELVRASGWKRFPPRLYWQPIFYPVLSEDYAVAIARDWNARDAQSGYVGYVLRFRIRKDYIVRYEPHAVGGYKLQEYWIPAEELPEFNDKIVGQIELIRHFQGSPTSSEVVEHKLLPGKGHRGG